MIIKDVTGKILPAVDVLKLAVKYLVNHLITTLEKQGRDIRHDEMNWVLTVPDSFTATDILKLSAEWAGIQPDHLVLVPESVSAFVYCQTTLPQASFAFSHVKPEYMVVDIGGIAADITVFKYDNYQLIQRFHTTGTDCGGRLMKSAQTSITKCIFCDNPGIYHCTECKSAFCQHCRIKHDKLPIRKTHSVTDLKEIDPSAFSSNAMCLSHKSEFIYFCTRCHVLICGRCVTTEHKGHDITDIKTVADGYRRTAENNISELKVAVTKLSNAVGQMTEIDKPIIKRTSESKMAEINAAVNKITKAVSFTQENKLDEEQSQFDMEMEEFQYDLNNKERIYKHQKNICESLVRLMHVSHDITFITSYETLKEIFMTLVITLHQEEKKKYTSLIRRGMFRKLLMQLCLILK
ncbi:unnamed protein product [Mytilus edulis]|uniref:B box-type domain-containing protein n=1 Tax=Mytilus edulis TaxID=6550 RepID=A0A8S3UQ53_MYTED|nr:unnamed protein product [Mytilus edulis]